MTPCPACATENDPDARYCDTCGAELVPGGSRGSAGSPAEGARGPLVVYAPVRPRAWWYPIGVWVVLSGFFLFVDVLPGDGIGWAQWPVGVLGIFLVGFPLLNLLEAVAARDRRSRRGSEGKDKTDLADMDRRRGP